MWWMIVLFVILCIVISVVPWCRRHENLWLYVSYTIAATPGNVKIVYGLREVVNAYTDEWRLLNILIYVIIFLTLTGIEQVLILAAGRLIWPEQENLGLLLEFSADNEEEDIEEEKEDMADGEEKITDELPDYRG